MAEHRTLEQLWKAGRDGGLSPLDQVRVVAYRDAYNEVGLPPKSGGPALLGTIAKKVTKIGGGHPSNAATRQLLAKVDEDPEWYHGKRYQATE